MDKRKITIGLFGTCGKSNWRDEFIKAYQMEGITYFNPQKDNWQPCNADIEAEHLVNDDIVLFPITDETYAFGSLAETGFSILQALKLNERREFIIMVTPDVKLDESKMSTNEILQYTLLRQESFRARALVKAHLKKLNYPNVWVVQSLDNMLKLSLHLHAIEVLKRATIKYTI